MSTIALTGVLAGVDRNIDWSVGCKKDWSIYGIMNWSVDCSIDWNINSGVLTGKYCLEC